MKKNKISSPPIPLDEAKQQAANWRSYCKKILDGRKGKNGEDLPVIKAFFIPLDDLEMVTELAKNDSGREVAGLRIYFRLKNADSDLSELQAMIVPVVHLAAMEYLKDWTHIQNGPKELADSSLVYDFTKPCPTECDSESLLCQ
jgi:hypothetical protein